MRLNCLFFVVANTGALVVIVNAVCGMQAVNSRRKKPREIEKRLRNSDDPDEGIK